MSDNYLTVLARANCLSLEDRIKLFTDLLDLTDKETRVNLLTNLFLFLGSKDVNTALRLSKHIESLKKLSEDLEDLEISGLSALQNALKALNN